MNWLGLTIFVFLPLIGAIFAFRSIRLLQHGVRVSGTITDYLVLSDNRLLLHPGSKPRTEHYPIVCFCDAAGEKHTVTMSVSERPVAEHKRKPVKVIYLKDKPETARIPSFWSLWLLPLVFFAPALILVALVGVHKLR